ncbi:hypothetical protein Hanom_Chr10g00898421 [Helianthus anomalus]
MTQPSYALTRVDAGRVRPCLILRGPRENPGEALYKQAIGSSFKFVHNRFLSLKSKV